MSTESKKNQYTLECLNKKCGRVFNLRIADHAANNRRVRCPQCGQTHIYDTTAILKHNYRKLDAA